MTDVRSALRSIFAQTLAAVDVGAAVCGEIRTDESHLCIAGERYALSGLDRILLVSIGKAATPMFEAAACTLRSMTVGRLQLDAVVVAPSPPQPLCTSIFCEGAHPTPDLRSRRAADAVLTRLGSVDERTLVLFLISGGASAMMERPLDPLISTGDAAAFNRALVGSGLPISEINVLRKHFSAVKGGRLAVAAARAAAQCTLIVSDVPEGAMAAVGSAPSLPDYVTSTEARLLFERLGELVSLPASVISFFRNSPSETPKADHPAFRHSAVRVILSGADLAQAAAKAAQQAGFDVEIDTACDEWEYRRAAEHLLRRSGELARKRRPACLIAVGELGVQLGRVHGIGGRNQQFALCCALALAATGQRTAVLSAGSDGIDGNSPAAGAIADSFTVTRARELGFDPASSLRAFDAFPVFQALGDLIQTGPTGNNLRDLRLLITTPPI